jgi:hypothetical protein
MKRIDSTIKISSTQTLDDIAAVASLLGETSQARV